MDILLHICCAPCLIYPFSQLKKKKFKIKGFYYNPNIYPFEEYGRRKEALKVLKENLKFELEYPEYQQADYFQAITGNENALVRCTICWYLRLKKTAQYAKDNGFKVFSTTLLVSPFQNHQLLKECGNQIAKETGLDFYYEDFRVGFRQAQIEAKARVFIGRNIAVVNFRLKMKEKFKLRILILFLCFSAGSCPVGAENKLPLAKNTLKQGVWISVFSAKKSLYSKEGVADLIAQCKKAKINEIYLQIFQSGNAYYDSKICDRSKYDRMVKAAGLDTLDLLLREAQENNISVFAWVNVLSLGNNDKANILTKYGNSILTHDQYQRPSKSASNMEIDKYCLRENMIFLEPGDPRVGEYILTIINEIINRYPLISGIHLDYIRYPSPVPFVPGTRFNKFGLTYGYGVRNVERFKDKTGLNSLDTLNNEEEYLAWDNWKRAQITDLVRKISGLAKVKSSNLLVSCAVIPLAERAYSNAFSDWSAWLEDGIIDYVVLMAYTKDNQFAKEMVKSALGHRGKGKIYIGMGLFLMDGNPDLFFNQYRMITDLAPDGIVFFSIDDLTDKIIGYLN